jgi:hypothetical protein
MGRLQDQVTLGTLTAQSSNFTGSSFTFSGYTGGSILVNTTTAGTTMTPDVQTSLDGTNWLTIPTSVLTARAAITATGLAVYVFTPGVAFPFIRFIATAFTGAFTAAVVGIFNHP